MTLAISSKESPSSYMTHILLRIEVSIFVTVHSFCVLTSCLAKDVDKPPFEVTETGYVNYTVLILQLLTILAGGVNLKSRFELTLSRNRGRKPSHFTITSNCTHGPPLEVVNLKFQLMKQQ